jgi:hypothetical protein
MTIEITDTVIYLVGGFLVGWFIIAPWLELEIRFHDGPVSWLLRKLDVAVRWCLTWRERHDYCAIYRNGLREVIAYRRLEAQTREMTQAFWAFGLTCDEAESELREFARMLGSR